VTKATKGCLTVLACRDFRVAATKVLFDFVSRDLQLQIAMTPAQDPKQRKHENDPSTRPQKENKNEKYEEKMRIIKNRSFWSI